MTPAAGLGPPLDRIAPEPADERNERHHHPNHNGEADQDFHVKFGELGGRWPSAAPDAPGWRAVGAGEPSLDD